MVKIDAHVFFVNSYLAQPLKGYTILLHVRIRIKQNNLVNKDGIIGVLWAPYVNSPFSITR